MYVEDVRGGCTWKKVQGVWFLGGVVVRGSVEKGFFFYDKGGVYSGKRR